MGSISSIRTAGFGIAPLPKRRQEFYQRSWMPPLGLGARRYAARYDMLRTGLPLAKDT
jgi:hypothetical protein